VVLFKKGIVLIVLNAPIAIISNSERIRHHEKHKTEIGSKNHMIKTTLLSSCLWNDKDKVQSNCSTWLRRGDHDSKHAWIHPWSRTKTSCFWTFWITIPSTPEKWWIVTLQKTKTELLWFHH